MGAAADLTEPTVNSKRRLPSVYWLSLLLIPIIGAMAFSIFQPIQVLPRITLSPGYIFTDQNGDSLTSEDMRGKLTFYTFLYTGCEAPCPNTVEGLKTIQSVVDNMDISAMPVEFVAISFDPENDTTERLAQFAQQHGADNAQWHFVTGDERQLKNVIGAGFATYYEKMEDGAYKFDPKFVLVDGWGIRRAVYRTASPDPQIIERDLNLLLSEFENREGINRVAYEAAHLFLCYPD